MPNWKPVVYEDRHGNQPFVTWLHGLSEVKRAAVLAAVRHQLATLGPRAVVAIGSGRALKRGLVEMYVEHTAEQLAHRFGHGDPPVGGPPEEVFLRVFCREGGDGYVLLLTGFDKGRLGAKRQQTAIAVAYELLDDSKDRFG